MPKEDTVKLQREKLTYRYDIIREGASGFLEAGWVTFAVLIALRHFQANEMIKASLWAAPFAGMLCTPFSLSYVSRFKLSAEKLCALYYALCALFLAISALLDNVYCYTIGIMIAAIMHGQRLPLMTYIYSENYRANRKGSMLSTAFITLYIVGMIYSELGGKLLDLDFKYYPWILVGMSAAALVAAWAAFKMPVTPLKSSSPTSPWKNISVLWKDKLFGWLIISWGLLGMSMLTLQPFKVEYLANIDYGLNLSNAWITRINYVIPAVAYILSVKVWGRLYDQFSFLSIRIAVNLILMSGVIFYFQFSNPYIISIGAALLGLGIGGGKIAFNLWVTDLAPEDKVSSYMSAHLVIVGLRGVTAPYLGYYLAGAIGLSTLGAIGACFIAISALMFFSTRKHPRMQNMSNYSSARPAFRA